jgi:hypothetical protein
METETGWSERRMHLRPAFQPQEALPPRKHWLKAMLWISERWLVCVRLAVPTVMRKSHYGEPNQHTTHQYEEEC